MQSPVLLLPELPQIVLFWHHSGILFTVACVQPVGETGSGVT